MEVSTIYKYRELWQQQNVLRELPRPSSYAIANATQRNFESALYMMLVAFISKGISISNVELKLFSSIKKKHCKKFP